MTKRYVVECIRRVRCATVGLASKGSYKVGDLVSYDGAPVKTIEDAFLYTDVKNDFPFDDLPKLERYFKRTPIKVVRKLVRVCPDCPDCKCRL